MFAFSPPRPPIPEELVAKIRPVSLAGDRRVALAAPWSGLLPEMSLRRGSTLVVASAPGSGGLTLALGLLAGATAAGSWGAVVGVDNPGVVAMADLGVDLARTLLVPRPRGLWAEVVGDLIDGIDVIVLRPPGRVAPRLARRVADRVRERGAVLVPVVDAGGWPVPPDLTLGIAQARWRGTSRLESRAMTLQLTGRGGVRPRQHTVEMPDRHGRLRGAAWSD